jgi:hypothetical protein
MSTARPTRASFWLTELTPAKISFTDNLLCTEELRPTIAEHDDDTHRFHMLEPPSPLFSPGVIFVFADGFEALGLDLLRVPSDRLLACGLEAFRILFFRPLDMALLGVSH